jgi:hypothetical protein
VQLINEEDAMETNELNKEQQPVECSTEEDRRDSVVDRRVGIDRRTVGLDRRIGLDEENEDDLEGDIFED